MLITFFEDVLKPPYLQRFFHFWYFIDNPVSCKKNIIELYCSPVLLGENREIMNEKGCFK